MKEAAWTSNRFSELIHMSDSIERNRCPDKVQSCGPGTESFFQVPSESRDARHASNTHYGDFIEVRRKDAGKSKRETLTGGYLSRDVSARSVVRSLRQITVESGSIGALLSRSCIGCRVYSWRALCRWVRLFLRRKTLHHELDGRVLVDMLDDDREDAFASEEAEVLVVSEKDVLGVNLANTCVKPLVRLYVCQRVAFFMTHFGSILGVHFGNILGTY